jgi:sulfur-carrier protein
MIRVVLPHHLRTLAQVGNEVAFEVETPATQRSVLDALEDTLPHAARNDSRSGHARSGVLSCASSPVSRICLTSLPDAPLPDAVASGKEPFIVIGAIAGG